MSREPRWRSKHLSTSNVHVPGLPGLYVIRQTKSFLGLPLDSRVLYVGRSLNLRRRLGGHSHLNELNPAVARHLKQDRRNVNVWYTTDVSTANLDAYEKRLIKALEPHYNRQRYRHTEPK